MNAQPYSVATPEQRDEAADDRDEAAWQRDRAGAARDREASVRDLQAEGRLQAARQDVQLAHGLLDAPGRRYARGLGADQRVVRDLLGHLDAALRDAEMDRQAAAGDRRAAAADRRQAAEDRSISAGHRGQAAIERAQHAPESPLVTGERWAELYARAWAARGGNALE